MPLLRMGHLTLCSLPTDVVRKIIRVNEDGMEIMRTITPTWNTLVEEHKCQMSRIRSTYPVIQLAIEEKRGQVEVQLYINSEDTSHFEKHGIRLHESSDPTALLKSDANARRGYILVLFAFAHLLIAPFLPNIPIITCPIILALCFDKFESEEEKVLRPLKRILKPINKIELLFLKNLSEDSLRRMRELTRNVPVGAVSFVVDDFNEKQRRDLMEIIRYHNLKEVAILAKKCEIVGLRPFLCDISAKVSVLYIEEIEKGNAESTTMFGQNFDFWDLVAANLLSCGMLSVRMRCGATEKNLCSLPKDIVRKIIRVNENELENMRTITPTWNALVEEHKCQISRIRSTYPSVDLVIGEQRGQVDIQMYINIEDKSHFEQHGIPLHQTSVSLRNANTRRGYILFLFAFIHLLLVPFLPDILVIACPVILALCFDKFESEEEKALSPFKSVLKIISKVEWLMLVNLSEHSLRRVRELTRTVPVGAVSFVVDDFNEEQRKTLMEIIRHCNLKEIAIMAKKCEIVGLRPFLCDISATVSVLHIEELEKGYAESSTMFGQNWGFWRLMAGNLLSCGMLSVAMVCGATVKNYADPTFEFMSLFRGIKN